MIKGHDFPDFFATLTHGVTIITPNRRLSATLHKLYQQYRLTNLGKPTWETPDILPLSSWIERLWQTYINATFTQAPLLLDPMQEEFLWEKIITQSKASDLLLRISETAHLAKSAWGLLQQWEIALDHPSFQHEDFWVFKHWATNFQHHCHEHRLIPQANLIAHLIQFIQEGQLPIPNQIILLGFTESYPQLNSLMNTFSTAGSKIQHLQLSNQIGSFSRLKLSDTEAEVIIAARYAKSIHTNNASATIGIVIPTLDKIRDRV